MYYHHFGLRGAPFNFTPPDRLFLSAAHREGLAALEWGFQEPSGLTLLVGEVGTGKTTLIHSLLARQNARVRIARVTNPTVTFEQMLQFIAQEIRIHPVGKGKIAILQALKTFLMDPDPGDRVVLIFDEAQGLSDEIFEELRLLSNFRVHTRQSLQIVLVGQPELAERLSKPKLRALNQRIGARAMLHPLRGTEVYDYVEHLLREQGGHLKIFSRGALDWLARLSGGLPRMINVICHNSLLLAFSEGSVIVKSRHVRAAAAEYNHLVASSAKRSFRASEAARLALHWLSGRGIPVVTVGILAIAALGAVFAFEVDAGRLRRWLVSAESTIGGRPQPSSPKLSRALESSLQVAAAVTPPSENPGGQQPAPQKQAPLAQPPATSPPKTAAGNANGAQVAHTNAQTKSSETSGEAWPPLSSSPVKEKTAASASKSALSRHAINTIRYDIKRANAARRAGRYNNAIWHLERAVALDPDNQESRYLLAAARRAKAASTASHPAAISSSEPSSNTITSTAPVANMSRIGGIDIVQYEIDQGNAYMRKGDYDNALRKFKAALGMDPDNEDLRDRITDADRAKAIAAKILPY